MRFSKDIFHPAAYFPSTCCQHATRDFLLRFLSVIIVSSMLFSFSACRQKKLEFPTIPSSSTETQITVPDSSDSNAYTTPPTITIATPLSLETCQYLAKLSVAKAEGMLGEGITGTNVSLELLDAIDLPFVIEVYQTSMTGASASAIESWNSSSSMPDIFVTDTYDSAITEGYCEPLNNWLADNSLLSANNIYPSMVSQLYYDDSLMGIPYTSSVDLLYINLEVLSAAGINSVDFIQDMSSLSQLLATMQEGFATLDSDYLPYYRASELLSLLPASTQGADYISMLDHEALSENQSFIDSLLYLRSWYNNEYCFESLSEEEKEELFATSDPRLSRKVGIWVDHSSEMLRYDNNMPNTLSFAQLPSATSGELSTPVLTVYPICVSSQSESKAIASDFAAFMALDEDALLLRARLENEEGFLPVVSFPSVWIASMAAQKYGTYLSQYESVMNQAVYSPHVISEDTYNEEMDEQLHYGTDLILGIDE